MNLYVLLILCIDISTCVAIIFDYIATLLILYINSIGVIIMFILYIDLEASQ